MIFNRVDDISDPTVGLVVRYQLANYPDAFEINASRNGIQINGKSPIVTDDQPIKEILIWCHYQFQQIRNTGSAWDQGMLESGRLSNYGI